MRGLDDTDRALLRMLAEDSRRSWREMAEAVDLSPPAVSDRVDRLQELELIQRFTVDIDRSKLDEGTSLLVTVDVVPKAAGAIADALADADSVEHVFVTASEQVVFTARLPEGNVLALLDEHAVLEDVREFDVSLVTDSQWTPHVGDVDLALSCAECGNTVTNEGETERLDGELYHFCCDSCRENFVEMYQDLRTETGA